MSGKKSVGSKFLGMFFEQEEVEGSENENKSTPSESTETTPTEAPVVSALNIPTSGDGVFDQKFKKGFDELISENNIPGIDYFEFREALKGMTGVSENNSYPMVFNTLKVKFVKSINSLSLTEILTQYSPISSFVGVPLITVV